MVVDIQNMAFCPSKYALLHTIVHFSTYVGSELENYVNSHTNKTQLSTAGYYFQMFSHKIQLSDVAAGAWAHFLLNSPKKLNQ